MTPLYKLMLIFNELLFEQMVDLFRFEITIRREYEIYGESKKYI